MKTETAKTAPANWEKILCIRMDNLGDLLMTEPAIRAIKNSRNKRMVHLLATPSCKTLASMFTGVDKVLTYEPFWLQPDADRMADMINDLVHALRKEDYDGAVIFNVYSQDPLPMAMVCKMAGIPNIAAYVRENPYELVNHWRPDPEPLFMIKHEVERQTSLAETLGCHVDDDRMKLHLEDGVLTLTEEKLEDITSGQPFIIMHPGASEKRRQYPAMMFAEAARMIRKRTGYKVLVTGTTSEASLVHFVAAEAGEGVIPAAGVFSLEELAAALSLAPVLVSNNTGPVHIAAAMGTPVVVLYARTNPQHLPWRTEHIALPFDVPENDRSKNTLVAFAHTRSFTDPVSMPDAKQITDAAITLLLRDALPQHLQTKRA